MGIVGFIVDLGSGSSVCEGLEVGFLICLDGGVAGRL